MAISSEGILAAVQSGNINIKNGNIFGQYGSSLVFAAMFGSLEMVDGLLKAGANDEDAYVVAIQLKRIGIARLLLSHGVGIRSFEQGLGMPSGQGYVMACMNAYMGKDKNPSWKDHEEGVCYGLTHVMIEQLLWGDLKIAHDCIGLLALTKPENIVDNIEKAQAKYAKKIRDAGKITDEIRNEILGELTKEERILLNMPAFFEQVELYQRPNLYDDLCAKKGVVEEKEVEGEEIGPAILSACQVSKLFPGEPRETLFNARVTKFSGIYTQEELVAYFENLKILFQSSNVVYPVALSLNSSNHTISVACDGNTWLYIDPNHMPAKAIPLGNEVELAKTVMKAFRAQQCIAFTSEIYSAPFIHLPEEEKENLKTFIDTWQSSSLGDLSRKAQLVDDTGANWLCMAVKGYDENLVRALLAAGAVVNQAANNGVTPLSLAVQNGDLEVVKVLLEAGAALNQARDDGTTPIFWAAQNGHLEVLLALLKAGADLNQAINAGATPIFVAAAIGHLEVVRALLQAGADPKIPCDSYTPLHQAAFMGHLDVVKLLLLQPGADVEERNLENGETPLMSAAKAGKIEVVNFLLSSGAKIGSTDNAGKTAFDYATEKGYSEMLSMLNPELQSQPTLFFAAPEATASPQAASLSLDLSSLRADKADKSTDSSPLQCLFL